MAEVVKVVQAERKIDPITCTRVHGQYDKERDVCLVNIDILSDGTRRFSSPENNNGGQQ